MRLSALLKFVSCFQLWSFRLQFTHADLVQIYNIIVLKYKCRRAYTLAPFAGINDDFNVILFGKGNTPLGLGALMAQVDDMFMNFE